MKIFVPLLKCESIHYLFYITCTDSNFETNLKRELKTKIKQQLLLKQKILQAVLPYTGNIMRMLASH